MWDNVAGVNVTQGSISGSTVIAAAGEVLVSDFGEEVVLLNLRDGVYYGLDGPGARIWTLMKQPITLDAIRDALVSEYEVDQTRCEADIASLLTDLIARGLAEVQDRG